MTTLLNVTPTTSAALVTTNWAQYHGAPDPQPQSLAAQFVVTWGTTAGATFDAWLQTSFDGGATAIDIAHFAVTTATSAAAPITRKAFNLSALTPETTIVATGDAALGSSLAQDGLLGSLFRVKYTVVGVYSGTTFRLDTNRNLVTMSSTSAVI